MTIAHTFFCFLEMQQKCNLFIQAIFLSFLLKLQFLKFTLLILSAQVEIITNIEHTMLYPKY